MISVSELDGNGLLAFRFSETEPLLHLDSSFRRKPERTDSPNLLPQNIIWDRYLLRIPLFPSGCGTDTAFRFVILQQKKTMDSSLFRFTDSDGVSESAAVAKRSGKRKKFIFCF